LSEQIVVPAAIRRAQDAVVITWPEPDHVGTFDARELRLACPCAMCVDELTNRPLLDPDSVPLRVSAEAITLVGAYGIRIRWSDGHGTGIYTFTFLRERCPCGRCRT
jgi:ATP-binding protein involved in chromosome partitioning